MKEAWTDCYIAPKYEVSDMGRVRNKKTGYILTTQKDGNGYLMVHIAAIFRKGTYKIAPLIYKSFNPDFNTSDVIRYRDGKMNNCELSNLYPQSLSEFNREKYRSMTAKQKVKLAKLGSRAAKKKLFEKYTNGEIKEIMDYMRNIRWGNWKREHGYG